jgi:hypothetical protein
MHSSFYLKNIGSCQEKSQLYNCTIISGRITIYLSHTKVSDITSVEKEIFTTALERIMNRGLLDDTHDCIQLVRYLHIHPHKVKNSTNDIDTRDDDFVIDSSFLRTNWLLLIGGIAILTAAYCGGVLLRVTYWNVVHAERGDTDTETDQSHHTGGL